MAQRAGGEANFPHIHTQGQLLPPDALQRILDGDGRMGGLEDRDYGLADGERKGEAINRAWQRLRALRPCLVERTRNLPDNATATAETRRLFLLPLMAELGYGQLTPARAEDRLVELPDGETASYAISHFRDESPIHLVGWRVDLDRKTKGLAGTARHSPHSLVQEFLNRSDRHLWGLVANGRVLRILRDNAHLSRQAWVEFDLEGIFEGECFDEFALLWLVAHHSRLHTDGMPPEQCRLEQWMAASHTAAVAALERLRDGVTQAIAIMGQGFMDRNPELRAKLASATLPGKDYFVELLRLVCRFVFLFVLEERDLLHAPGTEAPARERYRRFYSLARLRNLALATRGSADHDLWEGVQLVMEMLAREGCPALGLSPLGGHLWSDRAMPDLVGCTLANAALLSAIRSLAFTRLGEERRPVDWRTLGAEELGSVYESITQLRPEVTGQTFRLDGARGNERKATGSYYTPAPLIGCLLESALDPVLERAAKNADPEAAILGLKICDPACGSGHFLLAAAGHLARSLAAVRSGNENPTPDALRHAMSDVVTSCLYGVDNNPLTVELCGMGLCLAAHEPGRPLVFLDHHVVCADTLMGTSAELVRGGIPDAAFDTLPGDDRKACTALAMRNRKEMKAYFGKGGTVPEDGLQRLLERTTPITSDDLPGESAADMERPEEAFRKWQESPQWQRKKQLFDLWTAAFLLQRNFRQGGVASNGTPGHEGQPFGVTWQAIIDHAAGRPLPEGLMEAVEACARDFRFFHMELAFPEVAEHGGFDVILSTPPWESAAMKEEDWLEAHGREDLACLHAADRKEALERLKTEDPDLSARCTAARRRVQAIRQYCTTSGICPLTARENINLYAFFAEWMRSHLVDGGLLGCVVPAAVGTDPSTGAFFRDMVDTGSLVSLLGMKNLDRIFPDAAESIRFCLLTTGNGRVPAAPKARLVFFARSTDEFGKSERNLELTRTDFALINPETRTAPVCATKADLELTKAIYRRVPILLRKGREGCSEENPWDIFTRTLFATGRDRSHFRTRAELEEAGCELEGNVFVERTDGEHGQGKEGRAGVRRWLPLFEARMTHLFDHRRGTFEGTGWRETTAEEKADSTFAVMPRRWVPEEMLEKALKPTGWTHPWLMGWKNITGSANTRTIYFTILPGEAPYRNPLIFSTRHGRELPLALAMFSSFVFDYVARQKLGGIALTRTVLRQLPVLPPDVFARPAPWQAEGTMAGWLRPRLLELVYTSDDLRSFAGDMGYTGDPFPWDEERRLDLRCELDAAFFHLYLPSTPDGRWKRADGEREDEYAALIAAFPTPRDAVCHVMETFPIVRRNEEKNYGRFRSKEAILDIYDELQNAMR